MYTPLSPLYAPSPVPVAVQKQFDGLCDRMTQMNDDNIVMMDILAPSSDDFVPTTGSRLTVKGLLRENFELKTELSKKKEALKNQLKPRLDLGRINCVNQYAIENMELKTKVQDLSQEISTYQKHYACRNNCTNVAGVRLSCGCTMCSPCAETLCAETLWLKKCPACQSKILGHISLQTKPRGHNLISCVTYLK